LDKFLSLEKQWVLAQATQVGNDYMAQAVEAALQAESPEFKPSTAKVKKK
jgi:hypothetical protein